MKSRLVAGKARAANLDALIMKLEVYRSEYNQLIENQRQHLSQAEKAQFHKDEACMNALQAVINCLEASRGKGSSIVLRRYASETLLLLMPKQLQNNVPVAERVARYQTFLRSQKMRTAGKYLLQAGFILASLVLTVATLGVGGIFYFLMKNKVEGETSDRQALHALNHKLTLFKDSAQKVLMPKSAMSYRPAG